MFEELFGSESVDVGKGLAIAADLESRSIEFYNARAKEAGNGNAKKLFEFLAGEEKKHLKAVMGLASQVGKGAAKWAEAQATVKPEIFKGFPDRRAGKEVPMGDNVIAAAQEAETVSMEFYEVFAGKVKEPDAKKFFRLMAGFEKKHFELLSELYEQGRVRVESAGYPGDFI